MAPDASHYAIVVSFVPIPQLPLPSIRSQGYHPPCRTLSVPLRSRHHCPIAQRKQAHTLRRLHRTARGNSHPYLKHLSHSMCHWTTLQHPLQRAPPWLITLRQHMVRLRPPLQALSRSRNLVSHRHCYQSHRLPCQRHHDHVVNVTHLNVSNLKQAHGYHIESVNLRSPLAFRTRGGCRVIRSSTRYQDFSLVNPLTGDSRARPNESAMFVFSNAASDFKD